MGEHHNHQDQSDCGVPKFDSRDLVIREDIMSKAKELAALIGTSEEVQQFQKAEQLIQRHERVQTLISSIKKKQKEIVAFESFQNKAMVEKIEREIEELQDELDGIPVVTEFQQSQSDINYLLQLVISVIRDTVSDKVNVEAGSEPAATSGYGE
ncbi:YlbF family regulator [Paenibacillus sp. Marseille-P2973]|uniref:RicAFT regulatory complex protein RicA family protein n=1 Tax=Paenibacillus TaxID=44249 RepID=UPI001B36540B|nr:MULTISPECIES: YlbF family regulator [Paenibacillus]MBQ4899025.1 YlbF family regulator [Paenibacillus sp. Marseille-P2973]MDN4066927.1 YlbF family regulator [Paenibacillus vini]